MSSVDLALMIYGAGAAIALLLTDAPPLARIGLALVWPIGPLAFVLTLSLLLAASLIAFPVVGLIVGAGAVLWWVLAGP